MNTKGIYVKSRTHFNIKCVVFGILSSIFYWFMPCEKNWLLLPVIFTIAYVIMGWYDKLYNCEERLYSGSNSWGMAILDSIFKPQFRDETKSDDIPENQELISNQEAVYRRYMYLFHLMVVTPLYVYVGYKGLNANKNVTQMLFGFALLGMAYHAFRLINPRKDQNRSVYLLHVIATIPLALYVGWTRAKVDQSVFTYLLILGIIAGVYHGIRFGSLTFIENNNDNKKK